MPTMVYLGKASTCSSARAALADALVWLALHDLLYTDLRPPDIMVLADGSVRLVDYDDMRVVPGLGDSLRSGGGITALSSAFAEDPHDHNFAGKMFPALNAAIESALSTVCQASEVAAAAGAGCGGQIASHGAGAISHDAGCWFNQHQRSCR